MSGKGEGMEFFERLREERKRLKLSQTELATLAGTTKNSQLNYEKGKICPSATYLAAIAKAGVDVQYVLTGQRAAAPVLTPRQKALIDLYEAAPPSIQTAALAVLTTGQSGMSGVHIGRDNNGHISISHK